MTRSQFGAHFTAGSIAGLANAVTASYRREPFVWLVALLVGILHLAVAGRYDAQRNELYFLVCGWHPDFGYVDQPPLVPLIAAATQIFGINIWLLRLPAIVAAVGLVFVCAAFARLLGGLLKDPEPPRAKHNQGFDATTPVTEVSVDLKIDVQRVGLILCKNGLGAAHWAWV